jgi:hypothetical protein
VWPRRREFERLRGVLSEADEPLTAREILSLLDDDAAEAFETPHRVATVLGRRADRGDVEVVRDSPYRYRLNT